MPLVFYYAPHYSLDLTKWGMFLAGFFTVGQLSFWGNYLPRVYPTHLRGTARALPPTSAAACSAPASPS